MFESPERLALGLLAGFLFGFVLQKAQLSKYSVIVKQFLLKDFTMLRVMLTAIVVGGIGIYGLNAIGEVGLHIKPLVLGGIITGGIIFGVGMAVLGYCPGTGVAAAAEGSRHAIFGLLGMLTGAAVYAEIYPALKATLLTAGEYGKITLPQVTGLSHWAFFAVLGVVAIVLFTRLEKWQRHPPTAQATENQPHLGHGAHAKGA